MDRENMTIVEEIIYINQLSDELEGRGYRQTFNDVHQISEDVDRHNTVFRVLGRVGSKYFDTSTGLIGDLCTLPMWQIQFEDGEKLVAYPEEIIGGSSPIEILPNGRDKKITPPVKPLKKEYQFNGYPSLQSYRDYPLF